MFFPYGTDAPIYHWPFATGFTVLLNVAVFICQVQFDWLTDLISLHFGELNPLTWLTAVYAHAGIGHLVGNMIFLVLFGIIVEGKIGWLRFLAVYNVCGVAASAMMALIMFWNPGGQGLGASCAIFGLMMIAAIWAPENEIYMKYAGMYFFRPFSYDFNVSILNVAFFYVAVNFFGAFMNGFSMSTEMAHLLGAIPGAVIAVLMLKYRQVDCEGHDWISIRNGKRGVRVKTVQQEKQEQQAAEEAAARADEEFEKGMSMCQRYLDAGHFDMVRKRFEVVRNYRPNAVMPEKWYVQLINGYAVDGVDNDQSLELMREYLKHYRKLRVPMTLRMAGHAISEQRPRRGIRHLQSIRDEQMTGKQVELYNSLAKKAKRLIAAGTIELDDVEE